jgi:hypothetical protein
MSDLQAELNLGSQSKFQTRLEHPYLRSQTAVAPGPGPPLRLFKMDRLRLAYSELQAALPKWDGSPSEQESNLRAMSRILPRHACRPGPSHGHGALPVPAGEQELQT